MLRSRVRQHGRQLYELKTENGVREDYIVNRLGQSHAYTRECTQILTQNTNNNSFEYTWKINDKKFIRSTQYRIS